MENFYYVVSELHPDGTQFTYAITVNGSNNLLSEFKRYIHAKTIAAFKTKKKAEQVAEYWNDSYKANGTYGMYFKED